MHHFIDFFLHQHLVPRGVILALISSLGLSSGLHNLWGAEQVPFRSLSGDSVSSSNQEGPLPSQSPKGLADPKALGTSSDLTPKGADPQGSDPSFKDTKIPLRLTLSGQSPVVANLSPNQLRALNPEPSLDPDQARAGWHFVDYQGHFTAYVDQTQLGKDLQLVSSTAAYAQPNAKSALLAMLKPQDTIHVMEVIGDDWAEVMFQGRVMAYFQADAQLAEFLKTPSQKSAQVELIAAAQLSAAAMDPAQRGGSPAASFSDQNEGRLNQSRLKHFEGFLFKSRSRVLNLGAPQVRYELRAGASGTSPLIAEVQDDPRLDVLDWDAWVGQRVRVEGYPVVGSGRYTAPIIKARYLTEADVMDLEMEEDVF